MGSKGRLGNVHANVRSAQMHLTSTCLDMEQLRFA